MLGLPYKDDIGNQVTGKRKLRILNVVNQPGCDVGRVRRRDPQSDSMLLAYKG